MKLLQIGPYPPPLGGWSFHIKMFKDYLDHDGRKVENVVMNMGPNRKVKSEKYEDVQGLFDYIKKNFYYQKKGFLTYIHINGDSIKGFILCLIAQLIGFLFFQRCAISFHAGVVQVCFRDKVNPQKILAYLVFHMAQGIMCNSEEVKEKISAFNIDNKKIYAIPCFSKQYLQHVPILTEEEAAFIAKHDPVLSSYLFFRDEYEPSTLIEAFNIIHRDYPKSGLIIIGSTFGAESFVETIASYRLNDHILLAGDKSHDNFLTLIEHSDLCLRTHIRDGVCSSVMEALALGVPVIACDNGTRPPEVILYRSCDHQDLAEKISMALPRLNELKRKLSSIGERDAMAEELEFLNKMRTKSSS